MPSGIYDGAETVNTPQSMDHSSPPFIKLESRAGFDNGSGTLHRYMQLWQ